MSTPLPPLLAGMPLVPPGAPTMLPPGVIPPLPNQVPPPPPPPPLPTKGNFHPVLITHIPPHLSNPRALRDIAYPCGSTRGIFLVGHSHVKNSTHPATNPNITGGKVLSDPKLQNSENKEAVAIVRMATTHGANTITRIFPMAVKGVKVWNCSSGAILRNVVMANFQLKQEMKEEEEKKEEEKKKEEDDQGEGTDVGNESDDKNGDEESKNEKESSESKSTEKEVSENNTTEPIPTSTPNPVKSENNPSIEQNPVTTILEQSYSKPSELPPMAQKLAEISTYLYNEYNNKTITPTPVPTPAPAPNPDIQPSEPTPDMSTTDAQSENPTLKLDVNKVAAAAGGGAYDEEADPLNAPQVLEAVAKFKQKLEERDSVLKQQRMKIVSEKMISALLRARKNCEERKKDPPPLPPPLPPNPPPLPPLPPQQDMESGKRLVSNLPAWMTQGSSSHNTQLDNKRPLELPDPSLAPPTKRKARIDISQLQSTKSASKKLQSNPSLQSKLKKWISDKIVEYLGEEEETLIQFILTQTLSETVSQKDMMEEMQQVLDEDADDFVKDLYQKVMELASE